MNKIFYILFFLGCEMEVEVEEDALVEVFLPWRVQPENAERLVGSYASGFFVDSNLIFTAGHAIKNKDISTVYINVNKNGKQQGWIVKGRVIKANTDLDLALIETINYKSEEFLDICGGSSVFDEIAVAKANGEISYGFIYLKEHKWIDFTAKTYPGWSGAPVINVERGCVEGSLHGGLEVCGKDKTSFGPFAEEINKFLFDIPGTNISDMKYEEI